MSGLFAPGAHEGPFTILTVCSGNLCRSPIAQQLLRARLRDAQDMRVLSAGTVAARGHAMPPEAEAMSRKYGGSPDGHQSTPLTERLVEQSQLVLTATREHRAAVVSLLPRASRYAFTLVEFARLGQYLRHDEESPDADSIPGMSAVERVRAVAGVRGYVRPETPADDDIEDPYLEPMEIYERSAARIDGAVTAIAALLTEQVGGAPHAA